MIIRPSMAGIFQRNVIPPLDINGMPTARLAYSLRKLRADYTGYALRARNSSGTEADVAFYNGKEVTSESMTSAGSTLRDFAAGGNVTVPKWYNQSGNTSTQAGGSPWSGYPTAPDAVQTTSSKQPVLIISGTKTKLALKFETSGGWSAHGDFFLVDEYRLPNSAPDAFTFGWAGEFQNFSNYMGIISDIDNFNDGVELIFLAGGTNGFRFSIDAHDLDTSGSVGNPEDRILVIASYDYSRATGAGGDGKSQIMRIDGTESTKDTYEDKHIGRDDRFRIGVRKISNSPFDGTMREVIVWESQLSDALQVELERNMAIYNQVDL